LARLAEPGQTITAGFQTPVLFRLSEGLQRLNLHAFIDEADVGRAQEGQPAHFTVTAHPGKVFESRLVELRSEPRTDAQGAVSYEAVLSVDNRELLLRPGMTATVSILAGVHENVIAVPNAALRFDPGGAPGWFDEGPAAARASARERKAKSVWIERGGALAKIEVTTGASDGNATEIRSGGIVPGMNVVVDSVEPE
jgi:HlyD family secretion protein